MNKYKNAIKEDKAFFQQVMEIIDHLIQDTNFGLITLIIQDGRIVQIERTEKIMVNSQIESYFSSSKRSLEEIKKDRTKILDQIDGVQYGQLVIKIKSGRAIQVEKTEKRRFPELEGVNGDGI